MSDMGHICFAGLEFFFSILNGMSENALKLSSRIKSENTLARYRGDADVQKLRMDLSKEEYQPIVAAFMTLITTSEGV